MKRVLTALLLLVAGFSASAAAQSLMFPAVEGWEVQVRGLWKARWDHRDLLALRHPWETSEKGGFAQVSRLVDVPSNWTEPVSLSFYCSDDYQAADMKPDGTWLTAEGFVGHRYKQVLVDGKVVWSADVADAVRRDAEASRFRVPLPVVAGQKFLLSLLVYDAEASQAPLPGDFYQPGDSGRNQADDPNAARFMTHVYFGDIALLSGETRSPAGKRPSEARVAEVHNRRWPLAPFGDGWKGDTARLRLDLPTAAAGRFPLYQGIPLPAGRASSAGDVRFQSRDGGIIPTQKAVLSRWPDDSVRWLGVELLAAPEMKEVNLVFKKDREDKAPVLKVDAANGGVHAATGRIRFDCGGATFISGVSAAKDTVLVDEMELVLVSADAEEVVATVDSVEIVETGPVRAMLRIAGRFETIDRRLGSIAVYVSAYAGEPYLKLWIRVFNDTAVKLPVASLALRLTLPDEPGTWRLPSGEVEGDVTVAQRSEKERVVNGALADPSAPMFIGWAHGAAVVRHFRELFPKGIRAAGAALTIDLANAGTAPVVFTPGEAVSHEVWLDFGGMKPEVLAAWVDEPPLLCNAEYFCATGVLGPARTHAEAPSLRAHMQEMYANRSWSDLGQSLGLRHFPDSPYLGGLPKWSNDYYGRMLNLWSEWFMSGDRAWFDRAVDVCRHIMDVAVVHSEVPGKDWQGAMHGPGEDHVAGPWAPTLRATGLDLYGKLTGDPEAQAAFLGVVEYCLRTGEGMNGESIRQHAGPFDSVCAAYWDTGDVVLLDEGTKRVGKVMANIDRRRGVWPDTHGSRVYCGNVPWMAAQLARPLYWWYAMTGDVEAAQAVVALAESVLCENTDWDRPGAISGYSHNPHFEETARYDLMILPMVFAAYELTEDAFFLDAAKAQWRRWLDAGEFDGVFNVYWNTPWLMWQLHRYGVIGDAPDAGAAP